MKLNLLKPLAKVKPLAFVALLLAGCGQKGPLYLPEEPQPEGGKPAQEQPQQPAQVQLDSDPKQ